MPHLKQFKIEFDNGGDKPLLTIQLYVNNSKKFNALDKQGKQNAFKAIERFERSLTVYKNELEKEIENL